MKYLLIYLSIFAFQFSLFGQEEQPKKLEFNGYINYNQSITMADLWLMNNQIHNRLNAKYYLDSSLTFVAEGRNRIFYGDQVRLSPKMQEQLNAKTGYLNLNTSFGDKNNWVAASMLDRLYLDYTHNKVQLTIGRQRINWGRCVAWNPNDVFNTASYFDVDYMEKSGSDAIRLQYYKSETDKLEFAIKLDNNEKITAAGLYKFNKYNYDWQIITGLLQEEDAFVGLGWEGYIKSFSFRGESNYLYPTNSNLDTAGIFIASIGTDYMTNNSIFIQAEFIYSQYAKNYNLEYMLTQDPSILLGGGSSNIVSNVKTISFDQYSALITAQYSINPLLNAGLSGMYFFDAKGYFINPSLRYSIAQNCELSLIGQYFNIEVFKQRESFFMLYGLLSYSF